MTELTVLAGAENHHEYGEAKFFAFAVPIAGQTWDEMGIAKATMGRNPFVTATIVSHSSYPAARENELTYDLGYHTHTVVDFPSAQLLKVFAMRVRANRHMKVMGSHFLYVREGAARRRIQANFTGPDSVEQTAYVEGCFDLISLVEAQQQFGVRVKPIFMRQFAPGAVQQTFTIQTFEEGQTSRPVAEAVRTSTGAKRVVTHRRRGFELD